MRARNIKPGYFKNEDLCGLEPLARILFAGLWCLADRSGRLEDRPKKIKVEVVPYDDCDCDQLLEALAQKGFIARYPVGEFRYIQVNNFDKHQNPHKKEAESTIPAPDEHSACTVQGPEKASTSPADSLIPDSLIPDSLIPDSSPSRTSAQKSRFAEFWAAYPKKKSKGDAEKAWKSISPDNELVATMLEKLAQAKTCREWQKDGGQFIPHPATWLRAKGWEDEDTAGGDSATSPGGRQPGPGYVGADPERAKRDMARLSRLNALLSETESEVGG